MPNYNYRIVEKIKELKKDIRKLKKKMIDAYKERDYSEGNFYFKLLLEREKMVSKLISQLE